MLTINRAKPGTIQEAIEFLQTLSPRMGLTSCVVEFESESCPVGRIDQMPELPPMQVCEVRMKFTIVR